MGIKERLGRDHPLRAVRVLTAEALAAIERELASPHSGSGRHSIAGQMLLRVLL